MGNTYVISEDPEGIRQSELAFCKAKVLPLKQKYTTPRSELVAAQLNARAGNYVADALTTVLGYKPKVYYFSDSEITLYRLKNQAETYKVWVANRLKAIQETTDVEDWKKVDTAENPADISSNKSVLFKNVGEITPDNVSLDAEEVKKTSQMKGPQMNVLFASVNEEDDVLKKVLERHNNWNKSVKIIAWIRRFWTNTKQKVDQQKQMKPSDQSWKRTL